MRIIEAKGTSRKLRGATVVPVPCLGDFLKVGQTSASSLIRRVHLSLLTVLNSNDYSSILHYSSLNHYVKARVRVRVRVRVRFKC